MLPTELETRLKARIVEHLDVDEAQVVPSARFSDDLRADSLDLVEMVTAFEEEFGIEIPDEAAEKLVTVQDAIEYINLHSGPSVGVASTATDDPCHALKDLCSSSC